MSSKTSFNIKANRIFTPLRKYAWIFTLSVAIGGLWYPKIGLLVLGVIIGLIGVSFYKGRFWCGNICPHGSLFDFLTFPISINTKIPSFFKSKYFRIAAFLYFSFSMSSKIIKVSNLYGSASFLTKLGFIFVRTYLVVTVIGGLFAILISPRTWCNFCPMGALQTISYKLGKFLGVNKKTDAKVTAAQTEMCHECGKCARVCPMQLEPYTEFSETNQVDAETCIRCNTCVENCPAEILSLDKEADAIKKKEATSLEGYQNKQEIKATIEEIKDLADDTKEYTFKFDDPAKVDYQAGQFILVKIEDDPEMYRAYSISSYNENSNQLSVTIKKMEDGYGTTIIFEEFAKGDQIKLKGPMGDELVVDKTADEVLLVAGGIGVTPFVPIARDLIENQQQEQDIKLIYGVNKRDEFLYRDHFEKLAKNNSQFEYIPVVAFDDTWKGEKGFVTDVMQDLDLEEHRVYMCGPKPMADAAFEVLTAKDVPPENIAHESAS